MSAAICNNVAAHGQVTEEQVRAPIKRDGDTLIGSQGYELLQEIVYLTLKDD